MSLKTFLSIKSIICFLTGIPCVLAPNFAMSVYGATLDPVGDLYVRLVGCFTIGVGFICWSGGRSEKSPLRGMVLLGLFICDTAGFVVTLMAMLAQTLNSMGWSLVMLYALLAAGLGYFRFLAKE